MIDHPEMKRLLIIKAHLLAAKEEAHTCRNPWDIHNKINDSLDYIKQLIANLIVEGADRK